MRVVVFAHWNRQPSCISGGQNDHTHTRIHIHHIFTLGRVCQHMQRADVESYRNRINKRRDDQERKRGGGREGWRARVLCFSLFTAAISWFKVAGQHPSFVLVPLHSLLEGISSLFHASIFLKQFLCFHALFVSLRIPPSVSVPSFELLYYLNLYHLHFSFSRFILYGLYGWKITQSKLEILFLLLFFILPLVSS